MKFQRANQHLAIVRFVLAMLYRGELLTEANFTTHFKINKFVFNICFKSSINDEPKFKDSPHAKIVSAHGEEVLVESTNVPLKAIVLEGYEFNRWVPDLTGKQKPIEFKMDSDKAIAAIFSKSSNFYFESLRADSWVMPNWVVAITIKA